MKLKLTKNQILTAYFLAIAIPMLSAFVWAFFVRPSVRSMLFFIVILLLYLLGSGVSEVVSSPKVRHVVMRVVMYLIMALGISLGFAWGGKSPDAATLFFLAGLAGNELVKSFYKWELKDQKREISMPTCQNPPFEHPLAQYSSFYPCNH